MSLFPMYTLPQQGQGGPLPLYTDVLMDYEAGRSVWSGGNPVIVTGLEAVKGWAWRAIDTVRYQYSVFSWSFGCELESLVGHPYRADTKRAEAERYVREALVVSPYIRRAEVLEVSFSGSTLHLSVSLDTVYGRARIDV